METDLVRAYDEACWPIMLIWERINHAYASDSPPSHWGLQKGDFGFQSWCFSSLNERYTAVWDTQRSYWKVNSPFETFLFFIGPLFIDQSRKGLPVPPFFTVINSDKDFLMPANANKVSAKMLEILKYVTKPSMPKVSDSSISQQ